jgi:hypothetical protein
MAEEFKKDPKLFDYSKTPEKRNQGFSSLVPGGDLGEAPDTPVQKSKNPWSMTDKALLAAYEATNAADWAQTQQISRTPEKYFETRFPTGSANVIGTHPSRDKVNLLMGAQALGVPVLADQLPSGWRKVLLGALLAGKIKAVKGNASINLDAARF